MTLRARSATLLLIAVTAIWGSTFLVVQNALPDISPLAFLAARFTLASVLLLGLNYRRLMRAAILPGIVTGLALFAGFAFQTIGLLTTSASQSAFLTSFSVPLVPFFAALVYRSAPGKLELLGLAIASAGMLLLTVPDTLSGFRRGDFLSLLCAICFALQIVAVSYFAGRGNMETFVTVQVLTVALLSGATCRWAEPFRFHITPRALAAVAITGIFATAVALSLEAWAQQYTTATRAALIFTLEPVFAWLTSFVFLSEVLSARAAAGAALILFGIVIVELKRDTGAVHRIS